MPALSGPVAGSTEIREIHVAKLMLESGNWILPLRNGIVPSKPPLYHWCVAGLAHFVDGLSPYVARSISLLFGVGVVWLTALLGAALLKGQSRSRMELSVLIATGTLLGSYGFTSLGGQARVDMCFAFFAMLAVYAVGRRMNLGQDLSKSVRVRDLVIFSFACGIGILARGPLGLILPGMIVVAAAFAMYGFRSSLELGLRILKFLPIVLLIGLPWYFFAFQYGSHDFIGRQVVFENIQRFFGGEYVNKNHPGFYVPSFLRSAFPWSVVFLLGFLGLRSAAPFDSSEDKDLRRASVFCAAWFISGFVFFSIASGKRHSYLLPLYPAMALFLGIFLTRQIELLSAKQVLLMRSMLQLSASIFLIFTLGILLGLEALRWPPDLGNAILLFLRERLYPQIHVFQLALALGLLGVIFLPRLRIFQSALTNQIFGFFLILFFFSSSAIFLGFNVKNSLRSQDLMAAELRTNIDAPLQIMRGKNDEFFDVLMYYLDLPVKLVPREFRDVPCRDLVLARQTDWESILNVALERGYQIELVTGANQYFDSVRGVTQRAVVLFRCSAPSGTTT